LRNYENPFIIAAILYRSIMIMNFYQFSQFILRYQNKSYKPHSHEYPSTISFSSQVWDVLKRVHRHTSQFNYEHSVLLFDVDGDTFSTNIKKGSKISVSIQSNIQLRYIPKKEHYFEKQILIDYKIVKRTTIKEKDIIKNPKITPLMIIHSHPVTEDESGKHSSFFSDQDFQSFVSSKLLCTGLVTDEFVLACKHTKTPLVLTDKMKNALAQTHRNYSQNKELSLEILEELRVTLYRADFGKKLVRI